MDESLDSFLGQTCRDVLTGYEGIATAYNVHVSGNTRICLESFSPPHTFIEHWVNVRFCRIASIRDEVQNSPGFKS